jgi:hypothetical protein
MGSWNAAAVAGAKVFLTDPVDGEVGVVTFGRNSNQQVTFQTQIINVQPGVESCERSRKLASPTVVNTPVER